MLNVPVSAMPLPRELPIYELESAIVASLRAQGRLIIQAPTGSGKSTQIPQMLLDHGLLGDRGEVTVLQPRNRGPPVCVTAWVGRDDARIQHSRGQRFRAARRGESKSDHHQPDRGAGGQTKGSGME